MTLFHQILNNVFIDSEAIFTLKSENYRFFIIQIKGFLYLYDYKLNFNETAMITHAPYIIPYIAPEEYEKTKPLIEGFKRFFRNTNQCTFIIDFHKKEFLYVSDKIARFCGEETDGSKGFSYETYLKHVPEEERDILLEIHEKGLGLFHTFPTNERTNYTLCYDIDLIRNKKKTLLNHKLTPLAFTSNGQVWIALCAISPSAHKEFGHVLMLHTNGTYYEYDLLCHDWGKKEIKRLNETEREILLLSARGYTVEEIAEQICKSVNTIKTTKRNLFKRFETESIMNTWVDIMNRRQI